MYAEFSQISILRMSNSELFLVKDDEEGIEEFDILKRPPLEFQEECQATATSSSNDNIIPDDHQERDVLGDHEEKKRGEINVTASKKISLGEFKATDDLDDGFKTPTSLDQKIPVLMKQCPAAPRKPKALPSNNNKRKASTPRTRRNLQLDLSSQEVDSLFPRPLLADLQYLKAVKKARKQENQ